MKRAPKLKRPEDVRLDNIVDMGLGFSAMVRLFEKGSKQKLHKRMLLVDLKRLFAAKSEQQFRDAHAKFCHWGTKNVTLAKKPGHPASYGQVAKTLDVALKVAVYYSYLPDCARAASLSKWLNAAVDTKMMAYIKPFKPAGVVGWPTTIEKVDESVYATVQQAVRNCIRVRHRGSISPVQFDDIYWEALNR